MESIQQEPKGSAGLAPEWMENLKTSLGAERVFGTPVERDGTLLIPVASVRGGGGGGGGTRPEGTGEGQGAGFGLSARPAGVFVVRRGRVAWRPAVDVNRVLLGVQLLVAIALWLGWSPRPAKALPQPSRRRLLRRFRHA